MIYFTIALCFGYEGLSGEWNPFAHSPFRFRNRIDGFDLCRLFGLG